MGLYVCVLWSGAGGVHLHNTAWENQGHQGHFLFTLKRCRGVFWDRRVSGNICVAGRIGLFRRSLSLMFSFPEEFHFLLTFPLFKYFMLRFWLFSLNMTICFYIISYMCFLSLIINLLRVLYGSDHFRPLYHFWWVFTLNSLVTLFSSEGYQCGDEITY